MGSRPNGMTLERIDNNKGYEPSNCKWATRKEQANNTRRNRNITINDETKSISEWSRIFGINRFAIAWRLDSGWSPLTALLVPLRRWD